MLKQTDYSLSDQGVYNDIKTQRFSNYSSLQQIENNFPRLAKQSSRFTGENMSAANKTMRN